MKLLIRKINRRGLVTRIVEKSFDILYFIADSYDYKTLSPISVEIPAFPIFIWGEECVYKT